MATAEDSATAPAATGPAASEAASIFQHAWSALEATHGAEGMGLPKEIMWLGGAPGAGKGTNTAFIMRERGLTAPAIVVSDLLQTEEMKAVKAAGGLVGDREVIQLLLAQLLLPVYRTGVVVDGFPRSPVQADVTRLLYDKMMQGFRAHQSTALLADRFRRPIFRICVLFVDQAESVRRQLGRGAQVEAHNQRVLETGEGTLLPQRDTDVDPHLAKRRCVRA
jgi:adenylate kinase